MNVINHSLSAALNLAENVHKFIILDAKRRRKKAPLQLHGTVVYTGLLKKMLLICDTQNSTPYITIYLTYDLSRIFLIKMSLEERAKGYQQRRAGEPAAGKTRVTDW